MSCALARASGRSLAIESRYHHSLIGDLISARQTTELWVQNYPRDAGPLVVLAEIDSKLGQYEKAVAEDREASRLDPANLVSVANLGFLYLSLNRMREARAALGRALKDKLDSPRSARGSV